MYGILSVTIRYAHRANGQYRRYEYSRAGRLFLKQRVHRNFCDFQVGSFSIGGTNFGYGNFALYFFRRFFRHHYQYCKVFLTNDRTIQPLRRVVGVVSPSVVNDSANRDVLGGFMLRTVLRRYTTRLRDHLRVRFIMDGRCRTLKERLFFRFFGGDDLFQPGYRFVVSFTRDAPPLLVRYSRHNTTPLLCLSH